MAIKLSAASMRDALALLSKVSANSSNADVYKCVVMAVDKKNLILRGTDQVVFIEQRLPLKSTDGEKGAWLVVFDPLLQFVSKSGAGDISIEFVKDSVVLKSSHGRASSKLRDPKEFSWPVSWKDMREASGNAQKLTDAIFDTLGSASLSMQEQRWYNVSVKAVGKTTLVQANNTHRFVFVEVPIKMPGNTLLPYNGMKVISGLKGVTKIGITTNRIGFELENGAVYCVTSQGDDSWPVLKDHVPSDYAVQLVLPKIKFKTVLDLAMAFSDKKDHSIVLTYDGSKLSLSSQYESGQYRGAIEPKKAKGKRLELLMDADDMVEFLSHCEGEDFVIASTTDSSATAGCIIRLIDSARKDLFFITTPIVIQKKADHGSKKE